MRMYPQMAQRAVPISGSISRKLGHPLVPQYGRVRVWVRRRMRRMEEARPVMDAVAERDIMVSESCAFWRAVIAKSAIGCAAGVSLRGHVSAGSDVVFGRLSHRDRERGLGALTGSSRRTVCFREHGAPCRLCQGTCQAAAPTPNTGPPGAQTLAQFRRPDPRPVSPPRGPRGLVSSPRGPRGLVSSRPMFHHGTESR